MYTQLCADAVDAVGVKYGFLLLGHSDLHGREKLPDGEHFIRARMCLPKKREVAALNRFVDLKE
jgi:hypothetical protein